jgi:hypothetical protein
MGGRRKLYFEELHNFYSPINVSGAIDSRKTGYKDYVIAAGKVIGANAYKILIRKSEG